MIGVVAYGFNRVTRAENEYKAVGEWVSNVAPGEKTDVRWPRVVRQIYEG